MTEKNDYTGFSNGVAIVTDEVRDYLESLRNTGSINMLTSGRYLESKFDMSQREAHEILIAWISEI